MNITKEFDEFKAAYREGGPLTKVGLVVGSFLTLSSLTSLSGEIVKWKGFILEGINFYQSYFVAPVISVTSQWGLEYSQTEIHVATITSICSTVGMRLLALGQQAAYREINARYGSELKPSMAMYWALTILIPAGVWISYGLWNPTMRPWLAIPLSIFYPFFIVLPKMVMAKFGYERFEKNRFNYFTAYYAHMAAVAIIICILAAVNLGLNEPQPDSANRTSTVMR